MRATGEAKLRRSSSPSVENTLMYDPPQRRNRIYVEFTNLERTSAKRSHRERLAGFFR